MMNIIKRSIPTITGFLTGIFLWDLQPKKYLIGLVIFPLIGGILFNVLWIVYSRKVFGNNTKLLELDGLTFTPFFVLLLFPIRYITDFGQNFVRFNNIPSAILLIFSISIFIFLKIIFYEKEIKDLKSDKWIYLLTIVYFILFSLISIFKHEAFFSTAYDLAIYDQGVWGLKNFKMTNSIMGFSIIGGHFEPILFILALFYFIYSSPATLLILQTMAIAFGAIPTYLLARKILNNRLIAISLSAAYLIHPSMQYANLFDFHPMVLAVPFILFSFYFLEERNYKAFTVSLIIAGLTKEYIPLIFLPFSIYLFFAHKKRILGIIIAISGFIWFALNISVIIPYFLGNYYLMFQQNPYFGTCLSEVILTFITRPLYAMKYFFVINKLLLLILLLVPVAFGIFALLAPEIFLLGITELVIMMMRIPNSLVEIVYHHQSSFIPFIIVATIYGIKRAKQFNWVKSKNLIPAISIALLLTALLVNISYGPFTILYDIKDFNPYSEYTKTGHKFVSMIPKDASVAATEWVLPHLSQRENVYTLPHLLKRDAYLFESGKLEYPQYVLIDLSEALIDLKRSALKIKKYELDKLFNDKKYGIIASENTWLLLEVNANYEAGICKIKPFLDKTNYPYLNITIKEEQLLGKC